MLIDVIMLVGSHDAEAVEMTKNAVNSLRESESIDINLIIVESQYSSLHDLIDAGIMYDADAFVFPNEKFNYNKFLNYGAQYIKGDYVVISNNDVIFYKNWASNAISEMERCGLSSSSCISPGWFLHDPYFNHKEPIQGFATGTLFCGWNLIFKREVFDKLLPLDEQFDYCFQDNDIACILQKERLKHALIPTSSVRHLTSRSRRYFDQTQFDIDFREAQQRFNNKWHK